MSEPFYVSRAHLSKAGPNRHARLATGVEIDFGVHGPVKAHYRLDVPDRPLPVDYIVAATGG